MKEIFEYVLSFLKSRLLPMILIFLLLFVIVINRLFDLQIINGSFYTESMSDSIMKTMSVTPTRGRIFDRNGTLLAYNELAFSVKISDSGTYESTAVKNQTINGVIHRAIEIIESNGDTVSNDLPIALNQDDHLEFTVTDNTLLRFLRDTYGKSSTTDLSEEQKNATANDVYRYYVDLYGVSDQYSMETQLAIINLRRYMTANAYNRYMSFTIAYEVSDRTVAAILENAEELAGVNVEEEYIRKYVDSVYTSHILGYTGNASQSEINDLNEELGSEGYEANDTVGKAGIEQAMELSLHGQKGSRTVYVDKFGRITEVVDDTDPQIGDDVYLTIDADLQKKVYNAIEDKLVGILTSKIVNSDTTITYKNNGSIEDIFIPIKKVYFALIDNNIVSTKKIATGSTSNEQYVYGNFLNKQNSVVQSVMDELTDSPTAYGKLSEEMQVYIYYIYHDILYNNGIINRSKLDTSDSVYRNWDEDESISLKELLTYGISQNWIDMQKITDQQYTSLQEAYDALLSYIDTTIRGDTGFSKKIYRYMIQYGDLTGREVCMMLYEQGVLVDDGSYDALTRGTMNAYSFMMSKISTKEITPAQLALEPCSGAAVMSDPNTGEVLAMVSYPGYDNNKLSGTVDTEYYEQLRNDNSLPLINKATSMRTAPGSIFKMTSAITGLEQGVITTGESIVCSGLFSLVTPSPKCWIYPGSHGSETVSTAIRDSCNVYFYNVGYRLAMEANGKFNSTKGTTLLQNYSDQLGLSTKAGIEIYEAEPKPSDTDAIASAIGQGTHNYSALNLCHYASTIATSGVNYKFTLISKRTTSDGTLVWQNSPEVNNTMNIRQSTWDAVHSGMRMVINNTAAFQSLPFSAAGKSGTAQENTNKADHITFISYAPYENPEVALSVLIPYGYSSTTAGELSAQIYKIYYGLEE